MLEDFVPLLEVMLAGHPIGLRCDFFEISLFAEKQVDRIIFNGRFLGKGLNVLVHEQQTAPRLCIIFNNIFQLGNNDAVDLLCIVQNRLHLVDFLLKLSNLLGALEDVLPVNVAQLDFRDILRLNLVDAKGNHQVGDNLLLRFGLPDNADCLVNIQQDFLQAL